MNLPALIPGRAWLAAGAVVALLGLYAWADHQGYQRAAAAWSAKYEARERALEQQRFRELDRQATANAQAKAREAARLAAEQERANQLEALIDELNRQAESDPNRDRIGLGADSVERLNRIR